MWVHMGTTMLLWVGTTTVSRDNDGLRGNNDKIKFILLLCWSSFLIKCCICLWSIRVSSKQKYRNLFSHNLHWLNGEFLLPWIVLEELPFGDCPLSHSIVVFVLFLKGCVCPIFHLSVMFILFFNQLLCSSSLIEIDLFLNQKSRLFGFIMVEIVLKCWDCPFAPSVQWCENK